MEPQDAIFDLDDIDVDKADELTSFDTEASPRVFGATADGRRGSVPDDSGYRQETMFDADSVFAPVSASVPGQGARRLTGTKRDSARMHPQSVPGSLTAKAKQRRSIKTQPIGQTPLVGLEVLDKGRQVVLDFLKSTKCFSLVPQSGKVVVLDSGVCLRDAFYALLENDIQTAPVWHQGEFLSMLSVRDLTDLLRYLLTNKPIFDSSSLEMLTSTTCHVYLTKLRNNMAMLAVLGGHAPGGGGGGGHLLGPTPHVEPDDTLLEAARFLCAHKETMKFDRVPLIEKGESNSVLYVLSSLRILSYMNRYRLNAPGASSSSAPIAASPLGRSVSSPVSSPRGPDVTPLLLDHRIQLLGIGRYRQPQSQQQQQQRFTTTTSTPPMVVLQMLTESSNSQSPPQSIVVVDQSNCLFTIIDVQDMLLFLEALLASATASRDAPSTTTPNTVEEMLMHIGHSKDVSACVLSPRASLADVLNTMEKRRLSRVVLADEYMHVHGLVTASDILRFFVDDTHL